MRTRLSALGATLLLALGAGVGTAHASGLVPEPVSPSTQTQESNQTQDATNTVEQTANSTAVSATGTQTNQNGGSIPAPAPVAAVVPDGTTGGSGDVEQSNSSGADSSATNANHSNQSVDQDQGSAQAQTDGSDCGCGHGGSQPTSQTQSSSQDQSAENTVDQEANSTAVNVTGAQTNVNAPVRILSPGDSEVEQSNSSGAESEAGNWNHSDQGIEQDQTSGQTQDSAGNRGGAQDQQSTQNQSGENKVDQEANSTAVNVTGAQTNVNAPVTVAGHELNGCGCGHSGRRGGDVEQSNSSGARSSAWNLNHSDQSIDQGQASDQSQDGGPSCGCRSGGDQSQDSSQNQHGKNKVDQESNSTAVNVTGAQTNVNQPIRVLSPGSDDVEQSNSSGASSSASNWNKSDQTIGQDQDSTQTQTAPGGSGRYQCGCEPNGTQEQNSTKNQSAENTVAQTANSTATNATGRQTNVNGGGTLIAEPASFVGGGGSGGGGDVDQSNSSGASSKAWNATWSNQSIDQNQEHDQGQTRTGRCCEYVPNSDPCGCEPNHSPRSCACENKGDSQEQDSTQNQSAENTVEQDASSTADNTTGQQTNLNGGGFPRGLETFCGCGHPRTVGDVEQSNRSGARSSASNWNRSTQAIGQRQASLQRQAAA